MLRNSTLPEEKQLKKFIDFKAVEIKEPGQNSTREINTKLFCLTCQPNLNDRDLEEIRMFEYSLAYHIYLLDRARLQTSQKMENSGILPNFSSSTFGAGNTQTSFPSIISNTYVTPSSFLSSQQPQPTTTTTTVAPFTLTTQTTQPQPFTSFSFTQPQTQSQPLSFGFSNQPSTSFSFPATTSAATSTGGFSLNSFLSKPAETNSNIFGLSQQPASTTSSSLSFPSFGLSQPTSFGATTATASTNAPSSFGGLSSCWNVNQVTTTAASSTVIPPAASTSQSSQPIPYASHLGAYQQQPAYPVHAPQPYYYPPPQPPIGPRYYPYHDPYSYMGRPYYSPYNMGCTDPFYYLYRDNDSFDSSKEQLNLQKALMQRQAAQALWYRYGIDPTLPMTHSLLPELKDKQTDITERRRMKNSLLETSAIKSSNPKDAVIHVIPTLAGMKDGKQQIILNIEETPENRSYIPKIFNPNSEISFTITSKDTSANKSYLTSVTKELVEDEAIPENITTISNEAVETNKVAKDLPKPIISKGKIMTQRKSLLEMDLDDYRVLPTMDKRISATPITSPGEKHVTFQDQADEMLSSRSNDSSEHIKMSRSDIYRDSQSHASDSFLTKRQPTVIERLPSTYNYLTKGDELKNSAGSPYLARDSDFSRSSTIKEEESKTERIGGRLTDISNTNQSLNQDKSAVAVNVNKFKWTPSWFISKLISGITGGTQDTEPQQPTPTLSSTQRSEQIYNGLDSVYNIKSTPKSDSQNESNISKKTTTCCGVKLTRQDYYIRPSIDELNRRTTNNKCLVTDLVVGRFDVGKVLFHGEVDVYGLDLDKIVFIDEFEIEVYPDVEGVVKPPIGFGLNRQSTLTFYNVYFKDDDGSVIRTFEKDSMEELESYFKGLAKKLDGEYIGYDHNSGSLMISVKHFTKYSIIDNVDQSTTKLTLDKSNTKMSLHINESASFDKHNKENSVNNEKSRSTIIDDYEAKSVFPTHSAQNYEDLYFDKERYLDDVKKCYSHHYMYSSSKWCPVASSSSSTTFTYVSRGKPLETVSKEARTAASLAHPKELTLAGQEVRLIKLHQTEANEKDKTDFLHSTDVRMLFYSLVEETKFEFSDSGCLPRAIILNPDKVFTSHFVGSMQAQSVFRLIHSLWRNDLTDTITMLDNSDTSRKKHLLRWIEQHYGESARQESHYLLQKGDVFKAVLVLLSVNLIDEAVKILSQTKNHRLALMLSNLPNESMCCGDSMRIQIDKWIFNKAIDYMNTDFVKICMIIAKIVIIEFHNQPPIHICEGFDWVRCYSLFLNYCSPREDSIKYSFMLYREHFTEYPNCVAPPFSLYATKSNAKHFDLKYHLINLFCTGEVDLTEMFETVTCSPHPLDYSQLWHVYVIVNLIRGLCNNSVESTLTLSYSSQLEQQGHWQYAVYVLFFLREYPIRQRFLRQILKKHIQSYDQSDPFLQQLPIPSTYLNLAKAIYLNYADKINSSIEYLISAQEYERALGIALDEKIPIYVLEDKTTELVDYLNQFSPISTTLLFKNNCKLILDYCQLMFAHTQHSNMTEGRMTKEEQKLYSSVCLTFLDQVSNMKVQNHYQVLARAKMIQVCLKSMKSLNQTHLVDVDNLYQNGFINKNSLLEFIIDNI